MSTFAIWETGAQERLVARAATPGAALDKVDILCRLRYDEAAARVGARRARRIEIRGPSGAPVAWLDYTADPSRPYAGVVVDELRGAAPPRR